LLSLKSRADFSEVKFVLEQQLEFMALLIFAAIILGFMMIKFVALTQTDFEFDFCTKGRQYLK